MDRQFYLDLAASGLRMPIATDLILQEKADPKAIVRDGRQLGQVVEEAARRYQVPLALPLMDLQLEKEAMLLARGVAPAAVGACHFTELPEINGAFQLTEKMTAVCGAIRYIATQTDLLPVGIGIGPFSLMTKLISDPIAPVYMAGAGATADDEPEVALVEQLLEFSFATIQKYLDAQISSGAKAIIICEPAANAVYFSPNQLRQSYDIFDRYVMKFNLALRGLFAKRGVDLIFHDCGELLDGMVERFARLDPAIISLGSSRRLWEDARLLSKSTVLYGNLPTKKFYSDALITVARARQLADDLAGRMKAVNHPFIVGSECDVLSVSGCEATIKAKVAAFLQTS